MPLTRWKLTLEYDGTEYYGSQIQGGGLATIQESVQDAITGFCQKELKAVFAGRTDAGVHARGQVFHMDLDYGDRPLEGFELMKALNAHLRPAPIAIVKAERVPCDDAQFHARFSAKNKLYHYRIITRRSPPVLDRRFVWHHNRTLDIAAMQEAAKHLIGQHDFTSFRATECQAKNPVKTLDRLDVSVQNYDEYGGQDIVIAAEGRSFLHHQVRNMAGTLSLVGEGKWQPQDVKTALEAKDRKAGGTTAPASGLALIRIDY